MFARLEDFRFARWVKRLNRTSQILLSLILVAGMNYVAARHFQRWDLTPNKRYSLSAETVARLEQNVPRTPDSPLRLILVVQQDQLNNNDQTMVDRIRTLLKEYEYTAANLPGDKIPLVVEREVDPERQTTQAKQLEQYSALPLSNPDNLPQLIVMRGTRARALLKGELYGGTYNGDATDFRGENAITSAILDVVETKPDDIYFTTGHGEASVADKDRYGLSNFGDALRQRNFNVQILDLKLGGSIPANAKAVVIANPSSTFLPEEVAKLRRYLNEKNGRVLLFLEPYEKGTQQATGLEVLMHEWGLVSPNLMVAETDSRRLTSDLLQVFTPISDPQPRHKISKQVAFSQLSILTGPPRPVQTDPSASEEARRQVHDLLTSSKVSFAVPVPPANATNVRIDPQTATKGPFTVAAISERRASETVDLPGGKLLVFGNTDLATNLLFGKALGNSMLMLNSMNYLANHENMLSIRPQVPQEAKLNLVSEQYPGLGWRLALLPGAMALLGLIVCWVRSRS